MPTIKNIENLYFNATSGNVNTAAIAGVEAVEIENALAAGHTVNLGAEQTLALTNINTASPTTVTGSAAAGITLNNVAVVPGGGAQTLNVNTTNAALNLTAAVAASNIALNNATSAGSLQSINVDGDARLTLSSNAAYINLKTVDASENTGGVNYTQGFDTDLTFTGGTGNDRVQVAAAAITAQDKLDGGEGKDTLAITAGGLTANAVANVQNFEVLEARSSGVALIQDASVFEAKNTLEGLTVVNTGGAHTVTVTNLAATAKDGIVVNAGANADTTTLTTTVKGFVAGGTSDSATVTINANGASTTAAPSIVNLTFDNVDVLNLVSNGSAATNANTVNLTAVDAEKIVITGNVATTLTPSGTSIGITEVDASGLVVVDGTSAGLTFAQAAGATQSLLVTGSNGLDTITVTSAKGTVVANGGNDAITFSTAAAALADQSVSLSAVDYVAGGAVTANFVAGSAGFAVLNFSADVEALLKIGGVTLGTTNANQAVGGAINGQNNVALVGSDLQFDLNGDGVFNAADDFSISIGGALGGGIVGIAYDAANDFFVIS